MGRVVLEVALIGSDALMPRSVVEPSAKCALLRTNGHKCHRGRTVAAFPAQGFGLNLGFGVSTPLSSAHAPVQLLPIPPAFRRLMIRAKRISQGERATKFDRTRATVLAIKSPFSLLLIHGMPLTFRLFSVGALHVTKVNRLSCYRKQHRNVDCSSYRLCPQIIPLLRTLVTMVAVGDCRP